MFLIIIHSFVTQLLRHIISHLIYIIAQSVAEVIEIGTEKRSEGEVRKFKVHAFGEKVELNLKRSDGLLPKTLKVNVIDVDENGKQTMEDWSHEVCHSRVHMYE